MATIDYTRKSKNDLRLPQVYHCTGDGLTILPRVRFVADPKLLVLAYLSIHLAPGGNQSHRSDSVRWIPIHSKPSWRWIL
jgi:hypothetical protein